VQAVLL